ncbi:hypothetical protein H0H93_009233 [Arthromyces matolae]|nr:hypothetical protein H0H93_009233 [Arthromyces matolae]
MIRPCPSPSYSTPWSHDSGLLSPLQDIAVTVGAARTTNQGYGLASPSRAHTWPPSSSSTHPVHFLARREQEQGPPSSPVIVGEETLPSYTRNVMTSPYDSVGSWSSSYWAAFESLPPPHSRSLYATIPLPDMDELGSVEGSRTHSPSDMRSRMSLRASLSSLSLGQGQRLPNPNPSQFPTYSPHAPIDHWQRVRLHPVLENTGFHHSPLDYDTAAATMPSVDQITAMVASTGELFCILPSSRSPGITTAQLVIGVAEHGDGVKAVNAVECQYP